MSKNTNNSAKQTEHKASQNHLLNLCFESLSNGKDILLSSSPGCGKTYLLKRLGEMFSKDRKRRYIYFDCRWICTTPQRFIKELLSRIINELYSKSNHRRRLITKLRDSLLNEAGIRLIDPRQTRLQIDIYSPDKGFYLQLEEGLRLIKSLLNDLALQLIFAWDNFEETQTLRNYPDMHDFMEKFCELIICDDVIKNIITLGCEIQLRSCNHKLVRYRMIPFNLDDIKALKRFSAPVAQEFAYFTGGKPLYLDIFSTYYQDLSEEERLSDKKAIMTVLRYVLWDLLSDNGMLNSYVERMLIDRLSRARGYGVLKEILSVLSQQPGAKLKDISDQIGRIRSSTLNYLKELQAVYLIERRGYHYFIADPILSMYLRFNSQYPLSRLSWRDIDDKLIDSIYPSEFKFAELVYSLNLMEEDSIKPTKRREKRPPAKDKKTKAKPTENTITRAFKPEID